MTGLKAGTRMKSVVCGTEVMVIAASSTEEVQLTCGGSAMIGIADQTTAGASVDPNHAEGTLLGKRYVNAAGNLELLCTKPGEGSLAANGEQLMLKEAKALPSSD